MKPRAAAIIVVILAGALAIAALVVAGRGRSARPPEASAALSIAAASDLRFVLDELTPIFRQNHPEVAISVSYGSSGNFYAQLVNRAPFDLFLSADVSYPRQLANRGFTIAGTEFTYAAGRIAVWVPASSSLDIATLGLKVLTERAITHVAIANPEHAPYGRAAEAAMRSAGILDLVGPKLVYGENVSQTLQFVQSGSADAGIVALSLALAPAVASAGRYWVVPLDAHPRIEQGGTILRWAAYPDAAGAFRTFMLGAHARAVLKRYGFSLPGE